MKFSNDYGNIECVVRLKKTMYLHRCGFGVNYERKQNNAKQKMRNEKRGREKEEDENFGK